MPRVNNVLRPGEVVEYVGLLHWSVYFEPCALLGLAIGVGLSLRAVEIGNQDILLPVDESALTVALLAVISAIVITLRIKTTKITVTNKRVICGTGIIDHTIVEIMIDDITEVKIDQGAFARLFNFGNIIICGASANSSSVTRIRNPAAIRKALLEGTHS